MKKISILACILLLHSNYTQPNIKLTSPLLRIADSAGMFNAHIADILLTRLDVIDLVQGEKEWNGSVMKIAVNGIKNINLTAYVRRPEIIFGATFITINQDHELVNLLVIDQQKKQVDTYLASMQNKSLYDRQMNATLDGVFTGSYAINPINKDLLPIYISDYAIESFDARRSKTRLGIPAHNSKDFEFAKIHKIPVKIVIGVPSKDTNDQTPTIAAPVLDKNNILKEAYLGEYSECFITQSGDLNNLSLKDAAQVVLEYLTQNNLGGAYKALLKYHYNGQDYSIRDISKIETVLHKNNDKSAYIIEQKNTLKTILVYAQADLLEIVEKFLVNVKNTKSLITALIEESCALRKTPESYLLRWCHLSNDQSEKEIFRRDITSSKELSMFCKDLVNFLSDLAHSCPHALKNVS